MQMLFGPGTHFHHNLSRVYWIVHAFLEYSETQQCDMPRKRHVAVQMPIYFFIHDLDSSVSLIFNLYFPSFELK